MGEESRLARIFFPFCYLNGEAENRLLMGGDMPCLTFNIYSSIGLLRGGIMDYNNFEVGEDLPVPVLIPPPEPVPKGID